MPVFKKLQQARMTLQSTPLKKSGHNKFANYHYFELGDFLPQVNKIFFDLSLCSVVSFDKELATLRIIDTEDNSEAVFTSPMAEANLKGTHPIQNLGAVETYSRRYLYVTALEIVEHDALDSAPPVDPVAAAVAKANVKPLSDVKGNLTAEQVRKVESVAGKVADWMTDGSIADAVMEKSNANLDADETVYFWTLFDSKEKSAMTKEFSRQKTERMNREVATQS